MGECECGVTDRHSGCLLEYQSDQRHMASVQGTADPRVWRKSGVVAQLIVKLPLLGIRVLIIGIQQIQHDCDGNEYLNPHIHR